jgi:hypothetical protein
MSCVQSEDGIVPVRELIANDNNVRSVKLAMDDGILPVRRLS